MVKWLESGYPKTQQTDRAWKLSRSGEAMLNSRKFNWHYRSTDTLKDRTPWHCFKYEGTLKHSNGCFTLRSSRLAEKLWWRSSELRQAICCDPRSIPKVDLGCVSLKANDLYALSPHFPWAQTQKGSLERECRVNFPPLDGILRADQPAGKHLWLLMTWWPWLWEWARNFWGEIENLCSGIRSTSGRVWKQVNLSMKIGRSSLSMNQCCR